MARSRRGSRQPAIPPTTAPMAYSASCPSLSAMYDGPDDLLRALADDDRAVHGGQSAGNLMAALAHDGPGLALGPGLGLQPAGLHLDEEPLGEPSTAAESLLLEKGGGYDFLLQLQQDHLDASQRLFPHQASPAFLNDEVDGLLGAAPARRAASFHGSASFTNLASMEAELQRRQQAASKRKKNGGSERWHKLQRHKSFDSTVMPDFDFAQPSFSAPPGSNFFGPGAPAIAMPDAIPNAAPFMQRCELFLLWFTCMLLAELPIDVIF